MRNFGDMLLEKGLVTRKDLDQALARQPGPAALFGPTLVRLGAISEADLVDSLAQMLRLPVAPASKLPPPADALAAVERLKTSPSWLIAHETIVWFTRDADGRERLNVASRQAYDTALQEAVEQWHDGPSSLFLATSDALAPLLAALGRDAVVRAETSDPDRLKELAEEAPVIDFVNAMLAEALSRRASDVHVEAFQDHMSVRFRIDGLLVAWRIAPRASFDAIASRIKLLSGMDIAERRLPQDGRQTIRVSGRDVDVRVSAMPTTWGESLVLRFLGRSATLSDFSALGVPDDQRRTLESFAGKSYGIVLVCGPTGSGKTTTAYELLRRINDGVRKIVTVEDPVEIDLPGVMQTNARADIGLTFAAGLRSLLRQDPDVILVGEIRDAETAKIAVQAALTGHLVISTIHTSSGFGAVSRLLDLGVEDYLIADVLRGLVSQRLVRRLCPHCARDSHGAEDEAHAQAHVPSAFLSGAPHWREAVGCGECSATGYSGRVGVFEIAEIDAELRAAIRARASEQQLEALARTRGFRSLADSAVLAARSGATTLREALRVVSS
ncbi:MAG: Flp pilus assembly complex ATPase component TadA [Alphaproteobacteria bacterium]|nr:Flp pilus assembly complex ATPase component TadA [Alphaproteobacteria bacterium]